MTKTMKTKSKNLRRKSRRTKSMTGVVAFGKARDRDFVEEPFDLGDFVNLFRIDNSYTSSGFEELPKVFDDDPYEVKDFFDIFDTPLKPNNENAIDFIGSNAELRQIFDTFDDNYFNGKLTENGIKVCWTANRHTPVYKINKKNGKTASIRLSSDYFRGRSVKDLEAELLQPMSRAYLEIMGDCLSGQHEIPQKELRNKGNDKTEKKTDNTKPKDVRPQGSPPLDILAMDTSDITRLLKDLDWRYFRGVLGYHKVEVFWINQMSVVSGITLNKTDEHPIQIRLSRQLQKSGSGRPLIEELLHQMIRAFLMACNVDPNDEKEFKRIAGRVRKEANIDFAFKQSIVYTPEEYYAVVMKTHSAKEEAMNKRKEMRRMFAK